MANTDHDILGRADVNDLEAIMAISNTDVDEAIHAVEDNADAIFTWDYEKGARPALNKLYEKAKTAQWNGETDLDWSTPVDPAKIVETVPWIDAKYYASTQVMDEARHVEVFAKYLDLKLPGHYPINAHLKLLLDDIINDSRW